MPDTHKMIFFNTVRLYYFIATLAFLMWLLPVVVNLTANLARRVHALMLSMKRAPKNPSAAASKSQSSDESETSDAGSMPQHRRQN